MTDGRDPRSGTRESGPGERIEVAAGVLQRADGKLLVAERPAGKLLSGYLEFPGGKLEAGEPADDALARELEEELGITGTRTRPLIRFDHAYPGYCVRAWLFRVTDWAGQPYAREGQRLLWVKPLDLHELRLLPANRPALAALELPAALVVTPDPPPGDLEGFVRRFERALANDQVGGAVLRLRDLRLLDRLGPSLATIALRLGRKLFLNAAAVVEIPPGFAGLHLPAVVLSKLAARPPLRGWIGASIHNVREAAHAGALGLDYVIAGSVRETLSHPGVRPLGWDGFERVALASGLPTYAIGGLTAADVPRIHACWGQGAAAIRAFWPA